MANKKKEVTGRLRVHAKTLITASANVNGGHFITEYLPSFEGFPFLPDPLPSV